MSDVVKLEQFPVPQFMIDKMKRFMKSVQGEEEEVCMCVQTCVCIFVCVRAYCITTSSGWVLCLLVNASD